MSPSPNPSLPPERQAARRGTRGIMLMSTVVGWSVKILRKPRSLDFQHEQSVKVPRPALKCKDY